MVVANICKLALANTYKQLTATLTDYVYTYKTAHGLQKL